MSANNLLVRSTARPPSPSAQALHWICHYGGRRWRVSADCTGTSHPALVFAEEAPAGLNIALPNVDAATLLLAQEHDLAAQLRVLRAVRLALARWF